MTAYHYTTAERAEQIIDSGAIRPATKNVPEGEQPVVWFSKARTWEPTASKGLLYPTGLSRFATFPEMARIGIARFRVAQAGLIAWPDVPAANGMSLAEADKLARAGRKQGANPKDWLVSLRSVPLAEVEAIEVYQGNIWVPKTMAPTADRHHEQARCFLENVPE